MNFKTFSQFLEFIRKAYADHAVYIAGAGDRGNIYGQFLNKNEVPYSGFIDHNNGKNTLCAKPVLTYEQIPQNDRAYFIISSQANRNSIISELKEHGVSGDSIVELQDEKLFFKMYASVAEITQYTKRIAVFHNKYEGGRCFVIGNGPSLTLDDLNKLCDETTFACNTIYAVYAHTKWRPSFYVAHDSVWCRSIADDFSLLKKIYGGCSHFFTSSTTALFSKFSASKSFDFLFYNLVAQKGLEDFSSNCTECVYSAGTVTYAMLQLAVYMGFTEIYLLGIDFSFSEERHDDGTVKKQNIPNHMAIIESEGVKYENATVSNFGTPYFVEYDRQLLGYKAARQYADNHGIKIYNATRGGELEVFERVDFDTVIQNTRGGVQQYSIIRAVASWNRQAASCREAA